MANRVTQHAVEVLRSTTPVARVTQESLEVLRNRPANSVGLTQAPVEVLRKHAFPAYLTQQPVEVLRAADVAIVTQTVLEVLRRSTPLLFTQYAIEVLGTTAVALKHILTQQVVEILRQRAVYATGPGNGGETFSLQLAPSGTTETATLAATMNAGDTVVELTGTAGLPASGGFCLHIDDEVIYVTPVGGDFYRAVRRGVSNTVVAAHAAGASAVWTDYYDMAVASESDIAKSFTYSIDGNTYFAWLVAFDSSQAYFGGDRYATRIAEFLGVFPPGDNTTSKMDGSQPSGSFAPLGVTDDCPSGITVPARIVTDIVTGDVALLRYTNVEAGILTLGSRSTMIQSWYGFSRRDGLNNDVTATDPSGTVVDAVADVESHDVPLLTTTMPGTDRTYTYGPPRFSDKGWPIGVLAVRQGTRRVPHWVSTDWHDFSYVYSGFHEDATFAQVIINRNGFAYAGVVEESVDLPGSQDITGPNATWDDSSYFSSSAWYVGIFVGAVLFVGPGLNGTANVPPPGSAPLPVVSPGSSTGTGPGSTPPGGSLEGGEGGNISPPESAAERFSVVMV